LKRKKDFLATEIFLCSPRAQREARIETSPYLAKRTTTVGSPRAQREARIETHSAARLAVRSARSPRAQREARIETLAGA